MNEWEKMKDVAANKSLEMNDGHLCIKRLLSGHYDNADAEFIGMAANNWDKIARFVDAALAYEDLSPDHHNDHINEVVKEFEQAKKDLLGES